MSVEYRATARACGNVALIKYWGQRDASLNLPLNDSISMTLSGAVTLTTVVWDDDLHLDTRSFWLRESLDGPDATTRGATLRALGDHVAIYVDDETPLDLDLDCADPFDEVVYDTSPAFGFDNCDLAGVVEVFDVNVHPNVTGLFGEPSDVNGDCRVNVLLSHRLNRMTLTDSDPANDAFVVKAFAQPEIDLWEPGLPDNPYSNAQELIYVYAPDPAGLWSDSAVQLDGYHSA